VSMIPDFTNGKLSLYNCDCMAMMKEIPDKHFDLAIVDPPYGIDAGKMNLGKWSGGRLEKKQWDAKIPSKEYFNELFRVSKNQIIWGGNYFNLPKSRCWLIWDKGEGFKGRDFSEAELAFTSFDAVVRIFKRDPLSNGDYKDRIHKTQKPIALYKWLLHNYAKPGDKILDTHGGSMSIAIACHQMGYELTLSELDKDYFKAGVKRVIEETKQQDLFA